MGGYSGGIATLAQLTVAYCDAFARLFHSGVTLEPTIVGQGKWVSLREQGVGIRLVQMWRIISTVQSYTGIIAVETSRAY
jgi:hypothetical protein